MPLNDLFCADLPLRNSLIHTILGLCSKPTRPCYTCTRISKTRTSDAFFLPNICTLKEAIRSAAFVDRCGRDLDAIWTHYQTAV